MNMIFLQIKYANAISDDIDYRFDNIVRYNQTKPFDNYTYNLDNSYQYTENYSATYSFYDEIGKQGTQIGFVDVKDSTQTCIIDSEYANHVEVMRLMDTNDEAYVRIHNDFSATIENGIIELWVYPKTNDEKLTFLSKDSSSYTGFTFLFGGTGLIQMYNFSEVKDLQSYVANKWYHLQIEFDVLTEMANLTINGKLKAENFLFYNYDETCTNQTRFTINTSTTTFGTYYLDAIGYSWDENYEIWENLLPMKNYSNSIEQVKYWEFCYDDNGEGYEMYESNLDGFTDIEDGGDDAYFMSSTTGSYQLNQNLKDTTIGIYKNFNINGGIVDITIGTNYVSLAENGYINFEIYSNDNTLIFKMNITENSGVLFYYYYNGSDYLLFTTTTSSWLHYERLFYISYLSTDTSIFLINFAGNDYGIATIDDSKVGLGKIKITSTNPSASLYQIVWIDKVGLKVNGDSQVEDLAYMETIGIGWFDLTYYTHFSFNATGNFSVQIKSQYGGWGLIIGYTEFNGNSFFNLFDEGLVTSYPFRLRFLFNSTFILERIEITQDILTSEGENYLLEFSSANIDLQNDMFWVNNISHRLYFNCSFNSEAIEYIQATFDITNQFTRNASVKYHSCYEGYELPYFILDCGTSYKGYFPMSFTSSNKVYLLQQDKIIYNFIINVTDNDPLGENTTNLSYGYVYGFIDNISLLFIPNIDFVITTITLINGIIPIMVILVPTIILANRFGEKIIVPVMIIMTIICFVSLLIPLWLFSMLLLVFGYLLMIKRGK